MLMKAANAYRLLILLAGLSLWEAAAEHWPSVQFSIASPMLIGAAILRLSKNGAILPHIEATGGAAGLGMLIGTATGAGLGLLTWFSQAIAKIFRPFVVALGALPILALAPMMIIWFGIGIKMKIALAALSTVFVAFAQASRGAERVAKNYVDTLKGLNANETQIFVKVIIPGSLDWVFSSMRLNAGFALLGAFIGEFIASEVGLGHLVLKAAGVYDTPTALAASVFIMLLAMLFDGIAAAVEKYRKNLIKWFCVPPKIW